jgi:hypothetical protein
MSVCGKEGRKHEHRATDPLTQSASIEPICCRNTYLYEEFTSFISVHNESKENVTDVVVKVASVSSPKRLLYKTLLAALTLPVVALAALRLRSRLGKTAQH